MKKLCLFIAGLFLAVGLYGIGTNPKIGYKYDITWGMKRNDVSKKLPTGTGKLKKVNKDKNPQLYKGFVDSVEVYESKPGSGDTTLVHYYFLDDNLFLVEENLKKKSSTTQILKIMYIGLSETEIDGEEMLWDRSVSSDGYITQSIEITFLTGENAGCAQVRLYDRETYKKASTIEIPDYEKSEKSEKVKNGIPENIVEGLTNLAQKLVQSSTKKSTYAFIALTSDNGNALVENYVTDALTEAMLDTGKIKIVERASIEKIMSEQQFQSTALVNENTAVEIGNLSGANFVCYGTVKDLGSQLTLNVKVVEVSTAELCSMGRETVNKDKYLQTVGFEQRANNAVTVNKSGASSANTAGTTTGTASASKQKVSSAWEVKKKDNGIYTTYTFMLKSAGQPFVFVGYDKFDIPTSSRVKAGVYWHNYQRDIKGTYDIKDDSGKVINKDYSFAWWAYDVGYGHAVAKYGTDYGTASWGSWGHGCDDGDSSLKIDGLDAFAFTCNKGESARFFVDLFGNNKTLVVRHSNEGFRFATEGFWQTVEKQGLTREEIMDAIANEEF